MKGIRVVITSRTAAGLLAVVTVAGCAEPSSARPEHDERASELLGTSHYTPSTGPVVHNVQLDVIYWSNQVQSQAAITGFYDVATNSPYLDWMAQYAASRGSLHAQVVDSNAPGVIDDAGIQARLGTLIGGNPGLATTANTVYMLHFPPGMTIKHDGQTLCEPSSGGCGGPGNPCPNSTSCGYHGKFNHAGQQVTYSVIPDMTSGMCNQVCETALSNPFDKTTMVASHELIEAITDPNLTILGPNEVADLCENTGNAGDLTGVLTVGGNPSRSVSYQVAKGWSNQDNKCIAVSPRGAQNMTAVPADYDGDGYTDLAVRDNALGIWHIDYAANGFGGWDESHAGYGFDSIPVPADYDGDHKADLSVKDSSGNWFIDFSSDGFGTWNRQYTGYGFADAIPAPADYDGDGFADLSVKDGSGVWYIDYHGVGAGDDLGFGHWDRSYAGYGFSDVTPVPADYDGDGKADLSIKTTSGDWFIDFSSNPSGNWSSNQFGAWNAHYVMYGFADAIPVPGFYDHDSGPHQIADLSVKDGTGVWYLDNSTELTGGAQFGHWDRSFAGYGGLSKPVPGDYDHDGLTDFSVLDAGYNWFINYSSLGRGPWHLITNVANR